jgi:hypothetical protein
MKNTKPGVYTFSPNYIFPDRNGDRIIYIIEDKNNIEWSTVYWEHSAPIRVKGCYVMLDNN